MLRICGLREGRSGGPRPAFLRAGGIRDPPPIGAPCARLGIWLPEQKKQKNKGIPRAKQRADKRREGEISSLRPAPFLRLPRYRLTAHSSSASTSSTILPTGSASRTMALDRRRPSHTRVRAATNRSPVARARGSSVCGYDKGRAAADAVQEDRRPPMAGPDLGRHPRDRIASSGQLAFL